jgi:cell division protein FtsW (lipid II flippase)
MAGKSKVPSVFDETTNKLRLQLDTPLYHELSPTETRLTLGSKLEPVPIGIDEIFLRVARGNRIQDEGFKVNVRDGVLYLEPESSALGSVAAVASTNPSELRHNGIWEYGNLELRFNHVSGVRWFGLRLILIFALLGLILRAGPQVHWPNESLVFGCVALLISVGICLSARDYLFGTHNQYFPKYLAFFYYACMLLFWLRVPMGPQATVRDVGGIRAVIWVWLAFSLIHFLISKPFEGYEHFWSAIGSLFGNTLLFVVMGVVLLLVTEFAQGLIRYLTDIQWPIGRFIAVLVVASSIPLFLIFVTYMSGGKEAIAITSGLRIHLPTVLIPFMVVSTAALIIAARAQPGNRTTILVATLLLVLIVLSLYRLVSEDNGGTAVVGLATLIAFGLAWRHWLLPTALALALLVLIPIAAYVNKPERFNLAISSEQSLQYYDQARNLRLGRDLARAGGWWGLGQKLEVPAGLRSNLHNDLVSDYVAGYFGWIVLIIVLVAYALLYDALWRGLFGILQIYPDDKRDAPDQNLRMRQLLVIVALSLLVVSMVQTLWMITASIHPRVPMTGLDLQPISASRISIQSFVIVLLGAIAVAHTNHRSLPR